ncbi:MAG: MarR family winged helix-turn-helix transcriptional regulator [Pseudomonadota bacterium]
MRVYTRIMDERCICTTLRQAAAQSTAHYDAVLAPSGIKVTMFRLLRRIDAANSISITELAQIVGLDRSTLGRNLRVLEKQSLVKIGTGRDGRARPVSLTQTGREKLQDTLPLWRKAQREFSEIIGADALAVLDRVLDQTGEEQHPLGGTA